MGFLAIELCLGAVQFSSDASFKPTTDQMLLKDKNEKEFDRQVQVRQLPCYSPAKYEYMGYSIRQLCDILLLICT